MKKPILSTVFLCFILSYFSSSALGQADNNPQVDEINLTTIIDRLDLVIKGLNKVSEDLAQHKKSSAENAKDESINSIFEQLTKLNESTESLVIQLSNQTKVNQENAEATIITTKLLKELVALQKITIEESKKKIDPIKWQYKSIFGDSRVALEEEMNVFGKEGWEFFNITSFGRGNAAFARRSVK